MLPVLILLLMGIISSGTVYNQKLSLASGAREAGRYGSVLSPDQSFTSGTWASNVRDVVAARSAGDLSDPSATICVSLVSGPVATTYVGTRTASWYTTNADGSPCDATDTYSTTTNDNGLRVQVFVTRASKFDLGMTSRTLTLRSSMVVQSESAS